MSQQKRVLIYDDDLEILALCTMILKKENYMVETCKTCDNILNDVNKFHPDIILIDLWIPKIGGQNAVILLRENSAISDIPILLFSANDGIKKISDKVNANGYIQKPFDLAYFKNEIKKWIET